MAVVSLPIHLREMERSQSVRSTASSYQTSSVRSSGSLREIEEVEEEVVMEDKVYVGLGKEYKEGKSTLVWALNNTDRSKKVIILHVHRPAQMIPMMGAKFPASQLKESQVREHRLKEREKMDENLKEYLTLCAHAKVRAEKLVIEMDDVSKGIVELIALHGIQKLVMGAAADKHYSKKMKKLRSTTAINVQQRADPICKIWFVCKENLICTREAGLNQYSIPQSPATSISSSNQSEHLRSVSLPQGQLEPANLFQSPIPNMFRRRAMSVNYESRSVGNMSHSSASRSSTEGSAVDLWEATPGNPQDSDGSSTSANELRGRIDLPIVVRDEESEVSSMNVQYSVNEFMEDQRLSSAHDMEDAGADDEVYKKLLEAQSEAENLKRKAERDAIEAAHKAKTSENLYARELRQRKEIEELLARERIETEELKNERDNVIEELHKALKQESALQQQITDSNCIFNELDEKLSQAQTLLNSLQQENHDLEGERDNAVREVEQLRQRQEEASTSSERVVNFSEFSYSEIQQATHNFDDSMKIGEGGYGSVYKGFLRHTMVAIKVLKQESMQGQAEFHQEVEVLTKVRHPHFVTLIGVCSEAWALVYEYCINGSLEDRLACKDNTAPLTWQVRTRIAAEICLALIFLHSHKPLSVVHGDLKTANILIDANMLSKIGDFGICRLLAESTNTRTVYHHTNPKGTLFYMDPEFLVSGELTPLSDVYSFGIILLRLLTGRAPFGLREEVQEALSENRLETVLDPTAGDWPFVQARQLTHLALRCCEIKRKKRPNLSLEVWKVLEPMTKVASLEGSSSMSLGSMIALPHATSSVRFFRKLCRIRI